MDVLALLGFVLGVLAVLAGQFFEGGALSTLVNFPAFLIVFFGTLGAVLLQTPRTILRQAIRMLPWLMRTPAMPVDAAIAKIVRWSNTARKEGLLGLELLVDREDDEFARKGLVLLVDGSDPDSIRGAMQVELDMTTQHQLHAARVFEAMGGYSPTLGILGAVIGLIHVMGNLTDPAKLGEGIAVAFVATVYGVGFANLLFLPVANRLRAQVTIQLHFREMLVEGIVAIAEGENPRVIENKLAGFRILQ